MRDVPAKRSRILQAAADLFVANGYDRTTLAMVATKSGAAIGSVVHYFADKPGLAVAVREQAMERLATVIDQALTTGGSDVAGSTRTVVSAYLTWAHTHPDDIRVLQELRLVRAGTPPGCGRLAVYRPVFGAIRKWSIPLIEAGVLPPISPGDVYAIMLAPAEFAAVAQLEDGEPHLGALDDMAALLSGAACAGLSRSPITTDVGAPAKPAGDRRRSKARSGPYQGALPV